MSSIISRSTKRHDTVARMGLLSMKGRTIYCRRMTTIGLYRRDRITTPMPEPNGGADSITIILHVSCDGTVRLALVTGLGHSVHGNY